MSDHAVGDGVLAGIQSCIGGLRREHRDEHAFSQSALLGKRVHIRRGRAGVAIARKMVGPQGINRQQDDVRLSHYDRMENVRTRILGPSICAVTRPLTLLTRQARSLADVATPSTTTLFSVASTRSRR